MSTFVIKDIQLPEDCATIHFVYNNDDSDFGVTQISIDNNLQILNTNHGRLVDQEKVMAAFGKFYGTWMQKQGKITQTDVDSLSYDLISIPTVIEAETNL